MKTTSLKITGMTCASCVMHIQKNLLAIPGVQEANINFATETGRVQYDPKQATEKDLLQAVKKAGYSAEITGAESKLPTHSALHLHDKRMGEDHSAHVQAEDKTQLKQGLRKFLVALVLSLIILILTFVYPIPSGMEVMMILSLFILIYSGRDFFLRGLPALFKGRPGMDTLVALGVGAAFMYSSYITLFTTSHEEYFMDVAIITTFILLGRYLEARAKGSASAAIKKLLELSAKVAHRLNEKGEIEDLPIDQVQRGDRLSVKPGEKIPLDGKIEKGEATIDESMITGESIPVDKTSGDSVIGATINGNTSFVMRVEKVGSNTMLARIVKLVEEAQMAKAPIQKLVDLVSGYFVWGVMAIALVSFLIWFLGVGLSVSQTLLITVSILIIACPCALGLATPISMVVGSGKGANLGILIKNGESLEKVHQISAIAFDKTGTLTKGQPTVQVFENRKGNEGHNLSLALTLENQSEHPLAKSIVEFSSSKKEAEILTVDGFEALIGKGVKGRIEGKNYQLGSPGSLQELNVFKGKDKELISDLEEKGHTVLVLCDEQDVLALFGVQDELKASSKKAIELLRKRKIRTIMLTGDNEKVAQNIAQEVGIDEIHAGVSPEKKKEVIKALQKEGHFVAMVGDGINDSPALAQADIGLAMGTGTDVAVETGDLVLVKGDLMKAVEAIELSRATLLNIKQNLFWAFIYNSVGIPIAALGLLSPTFSAAAMAFSSVSVVLNALRLKRFKVTL